jgi:aminoglycoside phosphotransferase (APT) family kinase protein
VRPLRAHRHRCTFDVSFGADGDERRLIAKVYDKDRSDVFAVMDAVVASGFGPAARFAIPRPLAYLNSAHVFLQEWIPGTEAVEVFLGDMAAPQPEAARRCGAWLGRFHGKAPPQGRPFDPGRTGFAIPYWARRIREAGERFAGKADLLLRNLEAAAPAIFAEHESRAGHGTYMAEHVILSGDRTVSIDLDEYCVADPAQDLAWFIVSLERLGLEKRGSLRAFDRVISEFLRGYARLGPKIGLSHLPFYKAVTCLLEAHEDLYRRLPPLPDWSEAMLEEGIDSLEAGLAY